MTTVVGIEIRRFLGLGKRFQARYRHHHRLGEHWRDTWPPALQAERHPSNARAFSSCDQGGVLGGQGTGQVLAARAARCGRDDCGFLRSDEHVFESEAVQPEPEYAGVLLMLSSASPCLHAWLD